MVAEPDIGTDPGRAGEHEVDTDDPTQRVHHHARTGHDELVPPGSIRTLCGMTLRTARPEAAELPCCAMCAAEMGALGGRCRG